MMNIRKANSKDLAQLSLLFDGYRQFYQQQENLTGATDFIQQRLQAQDSTIFVAEEGEQLLGFTQLYPSYSSVSMQRLWILNDLFVAKEARKKGVADRLRSQAKTFAEETGSKGLILETDLDNIPAQNLYNRLGYQRQDDTYHYFLAVKE